jgi:hypothetical protein
MGCEVGVAITEGQLEFGPRDQIFCGGFDAWRRKKGLSNSNSRGVKRRVIGSLMCGN